jgi:hypothetical protein
VTTPLNIAAVAGRSRSIGAPASQVVDGVTYDFTSWSDGGDLSHAIVTPGVDTTYTAIYQPHVDAGAPAADLAVSLAGFKRAHAMGGSKEKATVKVMNVGTVTAEADVGVDLFVSSDPVLDPTDSPVGTVTRNLKLKPHAAATLKQEITLPLEIDGPYYLIARVGTDGNVADPVATNNVAASPNTLSVTPVAVNLAISFASTPALHLGKLEPGKVHVTVSNSGNTEIDRPVMIALDATPEAGGAATGLLSITPHLHLKAGKSKSFTLRFHLPSALSAGSYQLSATVDADHDVSEMNESDNDAVATAPLIVD